MRHFLSTLASLSCLLASSLAQAWTPLRNEHLATQVKDDPSRILPKGENYTLAADGTMFWHWTGADSYYHSGYWIDAYAEYEPIQSFILNLRWSFINPALSYGYTSTSYNFMRPALTWYNQVTKDARVTVVAGDLDRQTLGLGLILEDKNMSGARINAQYRDVSLGILRNGTGGYFVSGDLEVFNLDYNGIVRTGLQYGYIIMGDDERRASRFPTQTTDPFGTAYLQIPIKDMVYLGGEWGWRFPQDGKTKTATLAHLGIKYHDPGDLFFVDSWVQWRRYHDGFAAGWRTHIEHDYLGFEHLDKNYLATENIIVNDDASTTTGARLKLHVNPKGVYQASIDQEWGVTKYKYFKRDLFHFHREAVTYCPQMPKKNCVSFLYANKVVDTNNLPNINDVDLAKPYFKALPYFGVEGAFSL